ncbi:MAG: universal stress protein [Cyanobacteria bacterium P01_A01_bin.105]
MYQKILVVIDGFSGSSHPVYGQATQLAKSHRARLRLLHVLPTRQEPVRRPAAGGMGDSTTVAIASSSLWKRFDRRCMELLKRYADQATAQGIHTDYQQVRGNIDTVICNAARDWSADLLVLSHPEAEIDHATDPDILSQVPCSTLFVKPAA